MRVTQPRLIGRRLVAALAAACGGRLIGPDDPSPACMTLRRLRVVPRVINGLVWRTERSVDVINMSFGSAGANDDVSGVLGDLTGSITSMASPHAAGAAALLRGCDGGLSTAQVRDVLTSTAVSIPGGLPLNAVGAVADTCSAN
jgi:hypothetical protein